MDPVESFLDLYESINFQDLPDQVVSAAQRVITDFVGVAIGGTNAPVSRRVAAAVARWGCKGPCTLFGTGDRVLPHAAVFVNSTAGRALDYDDVHEQAHLHATVSVVPVALALSETTRVSGPDLLLATVLGFELIARMGLALDEGPGKTGMSTTYQAASIGAALAGARLLQLDRETTRNALGIAYSLLAGNQQSIREGADTMVVQQGLSAMGGVMALDLATLGITGPREIFTGRYGYFPVFHSGRHNLSRFVDGLGESWAISSTSIKPYPCCKLIHPALQALLELRAGNGISPECVTKIRAGINREDYDMICEPLDIKRRPRTVVDAIYSLPYVLSVGLVRGRVCLSDFRPESLTDPDVVGVTERVEPVRDESLPRFTDSGFPSWVELSTQDGRTLRQYAESVPGSPGRPMSDVDTDRKFRDCLSYAGADPGLADRLLSILSDLTRVPDASVLPKSMGHLSS